MKHPTRRFLVHVNQVGKVIIVKEKSIIVGMWHVRTMVYVIHRLWITHVYVCVDIILVVIVKYQEVELLSARLYKTVLFLLWLPLWSCLATCMFIGMMNISKYCFSVDPRTRTHSTKETRKRTENLSFKDLFMLINY